MSAYPLENTVKFSPCKSTYEPRRLTSEVVVTPAARTLKDSVLSSRRRHLFLTNVQHATSTLGQSPQKRYVSWLLSTPSRCICVRDDVR